MSTPHESATDVEGSGRHRKEHADPPSKPQHDGTAHADAPENGHGDGQHYKHAGHDPKMYRRL
jgi:hypothetical protein